MRRTIRVVIVKRYVLNGHDTTALQVERGRVKVLDPTQRVRQAATGARWLHRVSLRHGYNFFGKTSRTLLLRLIVVRGAVLWRLLFLMIAFASLASAAIT